MRSLLVLIDGLGDSPIPAWQGQTPFEHAVHPAMDALAASGTLGSLSICENDIIPESCSCILRLLGVDKKDIPHNRAYLELLAHNRDISEYEMVLRCNLAAVDASGRLAAFNGQGLTPLEMQQAAKQCDGILKDIEFIHLSEYRNLLVMNREASVLDCKVQPPQGPATGQTGVTRCGDGVITSISLAKPIRFLTFMSRTRTRSPGKAPFTKRV